MIWGPRITFRTLVHIIMTCASVLERSRILGLHSLLNSALYLLLKSGYIEMTKHVSTIGVGAGPAGPVLAGPLLR